MVRDRLRNHTRILVNDARLDELSVIMMGAAAAGRELEEAAGGSRSDAAFMQTVDLTDGAAGGAPRDDDNESDDVLVFHADPDGTVRDHAKLLADSQGKGARPKSASSMLSKIFTKNK